MGSWDVGKDAGQDGRKDGGENGGKEKAAADGDVNSKDYDVSGVADEADYKDGFDLVIVLVMVMKRITMVVMIW